MDLVVQSGQREYINPFWLFINNLSVEMGIDPSFFELLKSLGIEKLKTNVLFGEHSKPNGLFVPMDGGVSLISVHVAQPDPVYWLSSGLGDAWPMPPPVMESDFQQASTSLFHELLHAAQWVRRKKRGLPWIGLLARSLAEDRASRRMEISVLKLELRYAQRLLAKSASQLIHSPEDRRQEYSDLQLVLFP